MWQPAEEREPEHVGGGLLDLLSALLRCLCCLEPAQGNSGEGGQRLLSAHQEGSLAIEASASPPRLPTASRPEAVPPSGQGGPLLKGQGPSSSSRSSSLQPAPSPPMPLPFFSAPAPPRHKRHASAASRHSGGSSPDGGSSHGGGSPPGGASPTAKGSKGGKGSQLSLLEDDEVCPTCLDPYTDDNPKTLTRCGHHFHLPCLYEWLERSATCPVCSAPMQFEEIC